MPAILSFCERPALLLAVPRARRKQAGDTAYNTMLRIVAMLGRGEVRCAIIDPAGTTARFARLVEQFDAADAVFHVATTDWINHHPTQAKEVVNNEIKKITGKALPLKVLDDAFSRTSLTYDPIKSSLLTSAERAFETGFLGKERPDLSSIYDLSMLNEVLKETDHDPLHE